MSDFVISSATATGGARRLSDSTTVEVGIRVATTGTMVSGAWPLVKKNY